MIAISIIITNLFLQLFFTIGLITVFGLLIWLLNNLFFRLTGTYGIPINTATGFIGTPVHELGHAFFCIIFGHKISEIKLYQPNSQDGILGYVKHSYSKKNVYQQIGNFFIGFGPIIFGSGTLLLLIFLLVPHLLGELSDILSFFIRLNGDSFSLYSIVYIFEALWNTVTTFFSTSSLKNPLWWLFMIPACSIALHMNLSIADIKAGMMGLFFIITIMIILNVTLYFININYMLTITQWSLYASTFILNFLIISILLYLILLFIGGFIKGINLIKLKNKK